jgi:hypothetical protein
MSRHSSVAFPMTNGRAVFGWQNPRTRTFGLQRWRWSGTVGRSAKARHRRRRRLRNWFITVDLGDGCRVTVHQLTPVTWAALMRMKAETRPNDPQFARLASPIDDGKGGA